ncbi:MAG: hemerythrin domain-containing protein [Gaiellaceae bacterium]
MPTTRSTRTKDHDQLRRGLQRFRAVARELPDLSAAQRAPLLAQIVRFARGTLAEHTSVVEEGLYADVRRVVGDARVTATMTCEDQAVQHLIDALERTPVHWTEQLQGLLYGLAALIELHLEQELVYADLVESTPTAPSRRAAPVGA